MMKKIRKLKTSNPKEYWKIVNKKNVKKTCPVHISDFYTYFKDMNANHDEEDVSFDVDSETNNIHLDDDILDVHISENEIRQCVSSLKNDKSGGVDNIVKEYIKSSIDYMLPLYVKLFNIVLDTGILPEAWLIGTIIPIYKNKGDATCPSNYRPITLLSCLGKLFTSIISKRMYAYSDMYEVLHENQAGFRAEYSTLDHIFTLHCLIDLYQMSKRKLYCAFIDFKAAFDNVWRVGLWKKMLKYGISGKCFKVIFNMYNDSKSRIKSNNECSNLFSCNVGVRQGENLSPFLFALFLNDLEEFLSLHNVNGVSYITNEMENELNLYIKILVILYADDTVLLAESKTELQTYLNIFLRYCNTWKLQLNTDKTKIMIFSRGRSANENFTLDGKNVEVVKHFKYLGVFFSRTGSFIEMKKYVSNRAIKAMYSILSKGRDLSLSIEDHLHLFDKIVVPILLYGCEIWGFGNNEIIEKVHLKFCKLLLHVKSSTPNYMIYGELGRSPIYLLIKSRIVSFWCRMMHGKNEKFCYNLYKLLVRKFHNGYQAKWFLNLKKILDDCGMSNILHNVDSMNSTWIIYNVKQRLKDQFIQEWVSRCNESSKGITYRLFTNDILKCQEYVLSNIPIHKQRILARFRTTNHKLPIETGRWQNIDRNERKCNICKSDIGDEMHYILTCPAMNDIRQYYIPKIFHRRPNVIKFYKLFSNKNERVLLNLCRFIQLVYERVNPPG